MKTVRTNLEDRQLPPYTRGEEIFSMVSHIVGSALAIAALVICVVFAVKYSDAWGVVSAAVYGGIMVVLYIVSSIYHGLHSNLAKKVFQVLDRCSIYFLIAGTYTPIVLSALRPRYPVQAFVLFGIIWAICFTAATFTAIDLKKYKIFSMSSYFVMGWCVLIFIVPIARCLGPGGTVFLLTGNLSYTFGAVFFGIGRKKKFMHSIFHIFAVAGSVLHFFMILFYIYLPR